MGYRRIAGSSSRRETGSNKVTRVDYHVAPASRTPRGQEKRKTQDRSPAFVASCAQSEAPRSTPHGQRKSAPSDGTGVNCVPAVAGKNKQTLLSTYGRFRKEVSALMIAQKPFLMSVA